MLVVVLFCTENIVVFAESNNTNINLYYSDENIEDIRQEFINYFNQNNVLRSSSSDKEDVADEFLRVYGEKINSMGYEPHIVYDNNYEFKEQELKTNFESMSMSREGVYLILLSGDENTNRSYTSPSFSYSYNGTNYSFRRFSITAADDSIMQKSSDVDLLQTNSKTLIENCLNTLMSVYISSISSTLGTVASICGLNISNFGSAGTTTFRYNAATNWTRIYTQVYNDYYGEWFSGSCVEYAKTSSYFSGYYYNADTNSMQAVPQNMVEKTLYSSKYNDMTWRNQQAIIYVNNSNGINYNTTGSVKYYYGGSVKITHNEDF